jgi:hypothetical protein
MLTPSISLEYKGFLAIPLYPFISALLVALLIIVVKILSPSDKNVSSSHKDYPFVWIGYPIAFAATYAILFIAGCFISHDQAWQQRQCLEDSLRSWSASIILNTIFLVPLSALSYWLGIAAKKYIIIILDRHR